MSGISAGPARRDRQVFDVSGTWVKPAGFSDAAIVIVELWGGGGSGAAGNGDDVMGGTGGAYLRGIVPLYLLNATEAVTVGAGGGGVSPSRGGNNGGQTSFAGGIAGGGIRGPFDADTQSGTDPTPPGGGGFVVGARLGVVASERGGSTDNPQMAGARGWHKDHSFVDSGRFSFKGGNGGNEGQPGGFPAGGSGGNRFGASAPGGNGRAIITVIE